MPMDYHDGEQTNMPPPKQRNYIKATAHTFIENRTSFQEQADSSGSESTATNVSDGFNWSEEEQSQNDGNTEPIRSKRGRRMWLAFMKLARPMRVFIIGIIGVAVLITPLVVVNVRFQDSLIKTQVHVWSLWFSVTWAASCGTYLLVDMVPGIVIALAGLFGGQTERLKIQVELVLAVKAWLKLALDIAWAWIALSVIRTLYNPFGAYWTIVNRLMQAFFSAGIIIFVEKLFLQFVAINFHQKALADRLAENQLGLKALDYLSNVHPYSAKKAAYNKRSHKATGSTATFDGTTYRAANTTSSSNETSPIVSKENSSFVDSKISTKAKTPKRKKKMTSVIVDQVGEAIGQVALKNSKFNRKGGYGGLHSARRLARKLFAALSDVNPPRSHLVVEDFYPYFHSTAEAHEAFALFDKDGNGDISKREMREAVQRIYRERKALISGLKDVGSIVAKLDAVLLCVALILIVFIFLLIFNRSNTLASLVPLATVVLGFSFVFGHSAQTLFESLIFIFSTHVFDVGDLVMIDDQVLFVKEFGLFSTTFRRVDGQEVIAPNSLLSSTKLVHNLRRSKSMWETTQLMVSYDTPMEAIEQLRLKIIAYMNANSREWSDCALNIDKMQYQNAIYLNVSMEHRPNWQDWGGRWTRRTAFMRNLKTILEELEIRYTMPIQPVLMPRGDPTASRQGPPIQDPPPSKYQSDASVLGNAGLFQSGDYGRPSGPLFR
ncbi:Mechanosensitive ion channel protein Msy1 [Psilocybe cubensis]|uniref:Mechanosensitive ion channel protein Msy1 n=2 Tax=Psilocybe cubensis TaxID=181762 RepID=A0ACB8HBU8_PSICU|nr:Mechanosensitive ion channel protein Msy1 [Psilocybe cubensis]KAH9485263.1 Mechanosensitive ion channel protein Msy1 [Psilocybe cubensis]